MGKDKASSSAYEKIRALWLRDERYHPYAYAFVKQAVETASKQKQRRPGGPRTHISATELLESVRLLALEEFGYLAKTVLNYWGVHRSEDVGEIVFNMFALGLLGRSGRDQRADFAGGFDFQEAFVDAYVFPSDI